MKKSSKKSQSNKRNSWENNKNIRIVLVAILIVSLGVLVGTMIYTMYKWSNYSNVISIRHVNTSMQVDARGVGMNGDIDSLKFGKIPLGGGGQRSLFLNSTQRAFVNITVTGDMTRFLSLDKNEFIIEPNKRTEVVFYVDVPYDTVVKNYTGVIQVMFLKP